TWRSATVRGDKGAYTYPPGIDGSVFLAYIDRMSTVEKLPEEDRLELLQGTLEVLILRSLKLQPNHAYGISQFLQQQSESEFFVDNGSLYRSEEHTSELQSH